ncbi:hypothetical protein E2C01_085750 [Portunus trituberculatus]|uniref:Uncharacterized protein n=1 Tax=Portunus trituberculatus TaxID=210409 RepID=A0A5B7J3K5_PORTR|nr:hypothetical protein [Portunus trituberculatus]
MKTTRVYTGIVKEALAERNNEHHASLFKILLHKCQNTTLYSQPAPASYKTGLMHEPLNSMYQGGD